MLATANNCSDVLQVVKDFQCKRLVSGDLLWFVLLPILYGKFRIAVSALRKPLEYSGYSVLDIHNLKPGYGVK